MKTVVQYYPRFVYYPNCRDCGERLPLERWELGFCDKCWNQFNGSSPMTRRLLLQEVKRGGADVSGRRLPYQEREKE